MVLKIKVIRILIIFILLAEGLSYADKIEIGLIERNFSGLRLGMFTEEFKKVIGEGYEVTNKVFHVPDERIFVVKELPHKSKYVSEIQCFFYKDRLYRFDIVYVPDMDFWDNLIKELFKRYKKPLFENPDAYVWNDRKTEFIILRRKYIAIYRDNEITDIVESEENKIDPLRKFKNRLK